MSYCNCFNEIRNTERRDCYFYSEFKDMGATIPYCSMLDYQRSEHQTSSAFQCHCTEKCECYISKGAVFDYVVELIKHANGGNIPHIGEENERLNNADETAIGVKDIQDRIKQIKDESLYACLHEIAQKNSKLLKEWFRNG